MTLKTIVTVIGYELNLSLLSEKDLEMDLTLTFNVLMLNLAAFYIN